MTSGRVGGYVARAVGSRMTSSGAGKSSRLSGFHKLDIPARTAALEKAGFLTPETRAAIEGRGLALDDANNMIENVLATFGVPMVKTL
jgi:hydroxymethylglutaryl-CoA reductase